MTVSLKANAAGTQGEILLNGSTVQTFNQNILQVSGNVLAGAAQSSDPAALTRKDYVDGVQVVFSGTNPNGATIPNNVATKLSPDVVGVDSSGWWHDSTKRYIPQKSGWYSVVGACTGASSTSGLLLAEASIYKNGAPVETGSIVYGAALASVESMRSNVQCLVYCNGTTDYIELWGRCVGAGVLTISKFRLDIELAKSV